MLADVHQRRLLQLAGDRAARPGRSRTSSHGTAAQGDCHGKTGTLHDVANLAGYCRARDGHTLVFAFLANGLGDPDYVHAVEADHMAAALAELQRLSRLAPAASRAARAAPSSSITGTPSRSACASFEPGLSPATT